MSMLSLFHRPACIAALLLLAACSPEYNWREVRGGGAPYIVTLPGKPASHTRQIDLNGLPLDMTMTGAEVNRVTFAVGAAEVPDAALAPAALDAMKTALVRNIGGTIRKENATAGGAAPAMIEIEAGGPASQYSGGQPRLLLARFYARDKYIYQVVVVGGENAVSREAADTFFSSFKPN
jgi:hypothetical protein